jgi:acyl-homoserine-lactone acylase
MASRSFTAYFTQHGPIVARENGKWIAEALMNRPIPALEQSWLRTKATDLASYMKIAALKANSSNNTLFADDKGNIAFLVPQFIPRRDNRFDYTRPVDGSNPATAWHGLTPIKAMPNVINPPNGWVFNTNDWPWTAAGKDSPRAADYPRYMDSFGPNPRSHHALRMLTGARGFTKAKLIADAFDSYQTAFARLVPILVKDYDALPVNDPDKRRLAGPVAVLRHWDYRWNSTSIPTTLAVYWLTTLGRTVGPAARASGIDAHRRNMRTYDYIADKASPKVRLAALARAVDRLDSDFGTWGVPWGQINRYQRLDDAIHPHFDDAKPSIPVPFTSSLTGSLASFGAHRWPGTKKFYGNDGNSFVAVVEFGKRVSARAIHVGGASGHPDSPHFTDQAPRYATGDLRTVYFWPDQLKQHALRTYHPGD